MAARLGRLPQHIAHHGERAEGNPRKKEGGEKEQTVNNPVAIVDANGTIHFLYCLNYARCFYMSSTDDGLTFSEPREITAAFEGFKPRCPWNVLATGPGHGIQIKSGRLVVPVWLAYGSKPGDHAPSMAGTLYSDDHGATWKAGDIAVPNEGEFANPNETTLAILSDGSVILNTRSVSKASRRLVTVSADGATGWSQPRFDDSLWEPICMGSLTALPQKPGTLIFANPHMLKLDAEGKPVPGGRGLRENLTIKLSRDDGQTWIASKTLEAGKSAYSDLTVLSDGTILCFYERDSRLTAARFNEAWVESKE
ncbi:sialidase-1 [Prosthecobacter fusiformis]|uniref:exo-alpha-sialidase n=1 Tax=Prosthecobacter fusiformis TaxID=48464 RepID=A0A4R7RXJ6_9BACT|nr:sialidase family protein [Prosthecobacter fusiformis]TDU70592.1 sialidase-1 [Prosthecobacter fusiformis]